jgi:O-glycosyl hydrolase
MGRHAAPDCYSVQTYLSAEFHRQDARWFTKPWDESEWGNKLAPQPPVRTVQKSAKFSGMTVHLHPNKSYQTILGMGSSLEETTVYAMAKNHSDEQVKEILRSLIDPSSGIGMNLFRVAIGASDFADGRAVAPHPKGFYSYQDDRNAPFSIENDRKLNIIRVCKLAIEVAHESGQPIKFFGTAWSPPGWMKDSGELIGGKLKTEMVGAYAEYLRKFVEAYQKEGIPIYAITTANEHYFSPEQYPGCIIDSEQEKLLVEALQREFKQNGLRTKIWLLDHNFDWWNEAAKTLNGLKKDSHASYRAADSVAFHTYGGNVANMSDMHRAFPDKDIQVTEGSRWGAEGANLMVQFFRNWSCSFVSWVTMATQSPGEHIQGPYNSPTTLGPTLLVKNDGAGPQWHKIPEYYLYGQFMKFVKPGARRIDSEPGTEDSITDVAFKNPDSSIVIVAVNQTANAQNVRFVVNGKQFESKIPAQTVATFVMTKGSLQ